MSKGCCSKTYGSTIWWVILKFIEFPWNLLIYKRKLMELESQIDSINQINEKKGVDFKIISPRVTGYLSVCKKL